MGLTGRLLVGIMRKFDEKRTVLGALSEDAIQTITLLQSGLIR
jgi:hypothetical protein